jgi:transcriptional regulator GlxA family with amidase domain
MKAVVLFPLLLARAVIAGFSTAAAVLRLARREAARDANARQWEAFVRKGGKHAESRDWSIN